MMTLQHEVLQTAVCSTFNWGGVIYFG